MGKSGSTRALLAGTRKGQAWWDEEKLDSGECKESSASAGKGLLGCVLFGM